MLFLLLSTAVIKAEDMPAAPEFTCRKMSDIYLGPKDLCERIFSDAFVYEEDEDKAFTMWFFDEENPNDAITESLGFEKADTCKLEYFHKEGPPTPEGTGFTECHPWKDNACCYEATVTTHDALNEAYGAEYEWDRCGKMSQACERFFVQEACLYECDVNTANYRKCTDEQADNNVVLEDGTDCSGNKWQMYKMPIKASYCNAWYDACFDDYFCGNGDFFSCAMIPPEEEPLVIEGSSKKSKKTPQSAIALIVCLLAAVLCLCFCASFMVKRERQGEPIFERLVATDEKKESGGGGDAEMT